MKGKQHQITSRKDKHKQRHYNRYQISLVIWRCSSRLCICKYRRLYVFCALPVPPAILLLAVRHLKADLSSIPQLLVCIRIWAFDRNRLIISWNTVMRKSVYNLNVRPFFGARGSPLVKERKTKLGLNCVIRFKS